MRILEDEKRNVPASKREVDDLRKIVKRNEQRALTRGLIDAKR